MSSVKPDVYVKVSGDGMRVKAGALAPNMRINRGWLDNRIKSIGNIHFAYGWQGALRQVGSAHLSYGLGGQITQVSPDERVTIVVESQSRRHIPGTFEE